MNIGYLEDIFEPYCAYYGLISKKGKRNTNQDSLALYKLETTIGEVIFAICCDGLGGMDQGEVASSYVVTKMSEWFNSTCINSISTRFNKKTIINMVNSILFTLHNDLKKYGISKGIKLGTTITMYLSIGKKYYVLNIGDSPAILIGKRIEQLTFCSNYSDNVLSECIGLGNYRGVHVKCGSLKKGKYILLGTDGFFNHICDEEIMKQFNCKELISNDILNRKLNNIYRIAEVRGEEDNASAIILSY